MVWAFAWVSWIVYFILKLRENRSDNKIRTSIPLSFMILLQLLTGHAQTFSFTMGLGLLVLFIPLEPGLKENGKKFLVFIGSFFLAISVAAVQLLPTIEYLFFSQRSSEVGYEYASNFSFWPLRIVTILFGSFWGNPGLNRFFAGGTYWEDQIYFGVFSFVLVAILLTRLIFKGARKLFRKENQIIIFYLVLCFFSFLLALGKNSFLYPIFYNYFPGVRLFQGPSRFLVLFSFAFCILISYGFDYWEEKSFNPRKTGLLTASSVAILISSIIIYFSTPTLPTQIFISIWMTSVFLFLFSLITILKVLIEKKYTFIIKIFTIVLLLGDLVFLNFPYGHFITNEFYNTPNLIDSQSSAEKTVFIDSESENFLKFNKLYRFDRFQFLDSMQSKFPSYLPNGNLVFDRYRMLNNFDPFVPERYSLFMNWIAGLPFETQNKILSLVSVNERLNLDIDLPNGIGTFPINAKPLVQWYDCAQFESQDNILNKMLISSENRCVFIENPIYSAGKVVEDNGDSNILNYLIKENGTININYASKSNGWIVFRQTWYPGWEAIIDGIDKRDVQQVDFLFQGIYVPAGVHSLSIIYQPKSFLIGMWISLATLLLISVTVIIWIINKRK
jgi:hypothetical protein